MCQAVPTGLHTRWALEYEFIKFKPCQKKSKTLETWSCHIFRESDNSVRPKVSTRQVHRQKLILMLLMTFVDFATLYLKLWVVIIIFVLVRNLVFLPSIKKFREGTKKRKIDELRRQFKKMALTSSRCTNMIGRFSTRCTVLLSTISANVSPRKWH